MRVLLSAYQAGPGMGSASQIGWEWYSRLSRHVPVTLITHERNRKALERAGAPLPGTDVQYIDTEWFAGPLFRLASRMFPRSEHSVFLVSSIDFFPFDIAALRRARALRAAGAQWDVVHAATPVSPSAVTRLFKLGVPTILGPWNGGLRSPRTFPDLMRQDSGWIYRIRDLARIMDSVVGSTRRASKILVANATTRDAIPAPSREKCVTVLENGVDLDLFRPAEWPEAPGRGKPLKVLFVGRLIPVKGIGFLLEAARRLKGEVPLEIKIVGDGPMRTEWQSMASELGVEAMVTFTGALPLAEVAPMHCDSHLFCLPCVRESGGAVLLEAMASARPIVAVRYGGPAVVLNDEVGRALPPDGPEAVIRALCDCFRDAYANPDAWRERGLAGRRRAESEFSWDAKVQAALRLYESLNGGS